MPSGHGDVHSFPTRRSSDLDALELRAAELEERERELDLLQARHARARAWAETAIGTRDRKSTRLNSSHRCISYAVFCLKKKMEQLRQEEHDEQQAAKDIREN